MDELISFGRKLEELAAERDLTLEQAIEVMAHFGCPEDEARAAIYMGQLRLGEEN